MAMRQPKIPRPTPAPTSPVAAGAPNTASPSQGLGQAFSGFSFAPRLSAFAANRSGRRSLLGGGA